MTQPEALTPTDKALACLKYILAVLDCDEDPSESLRNEASAQLKLALQAQGALQAAPEPIGWRYRDTSYDDLNAREGWAPIWQVRWGAERPHIAWTHHVIEPIYGAAPQAATGATPEPDLPSIKRCPACNGAGSVGRLGPCPSCKGFGSIIGAAPQAAIGATPEPPTLDDVLDALNVFNPGEIIGPDQREKWTEDDFISVKSLPEFIHRVGRAWYLAGPASIGVPSLLSVGEKS